MQFGTHAVRVSSLGDAQVGIGARRHLRQMGDAQHLPPRAQGLQQLPHRRGHRAAHTTVHFIEHQCRDLTRLARGHLHGQRDARQFTTGRHA